MHLKNSLYVVRVNCGAGVAPAIDKCVDCLDVIDHHQDAARENQKKSNNAKSADSIETDEDI